MRGHGSALLRGEGHVGMMLDDDVGQKQGVSIRK